MSGGAIGRMRALVVWGALASLGAAIGVLALLRNFEREGAGGRWRRAHATGEEVDALLRAPPAEEGADAAPPAGEAPAPVTPPDDVA